jgi:hypothetical protein
MNSLEQKHYWSGNSPPFMEAEGSVPFSQDPVTVLCSEPFESSPPPHIAFLVRSITLHLRLRVPSGLFPLDFLTTHFVGIFHVIVQLIIPTIFGEEDKL